MSLDVLNVFYLLGAFLLVAIAMLVACRLCSANGRSEDEYESRYSDVKRAKKDVPIMLRRQAD